MSRTGRTGRAAGSGCSERSRTASSTSALSTTSSSAIVVARADDRHSPGLVGPRAQRQLDPEDPVLVGGARPIGLDVGVEPHRPPERPRLDLDLLVDAALGLLDRALAGDHEVPTGDLEVQAFEPDAGEVGLHDRLRLLATAVVDVDARRESGGPAAGAAHAAPDVAEQLVHLTPHPLEVEEEVTVRGHGRNVSGRL